MRLPLVIGHIAIEMICLVEEGDKASSSTVCSTRYDASSLHFDLLSLEDLSTVLCEYFLVDFLGAIAKSPLECDFLS